MHEWMLHAVINGRLTACLHARSAKAATCKSVDGSSMLLLDSGCQYDCGTTDITRTVHTGAPADHMRRCFTRVLQVRCLRCLVPGAWPD